MDRWVRTSEVVESVFFWLLMEHKTRKGLLELKNTFCRPNAAPRVFIWHPQGPNRLQKAPRGLSKRLQGYQMGSKRLSEGSQGGSKGPKRLPKRPQKEPKGHQNGAKMVLGSPKEAKRLPGLQNDANMTPKTAPKIARFLVIFEARFEHAF